MTKTIDKAEDFFNDTNKCGHLLVGQYVALDKLITAYNFTACFGNKKELKAIESKLAEMLNKLGV